MIGGSPVKDYSDDKLFLDNLDANTLSGTFNVGFKSIILDENGTLTYFNNGLPALIGYTREEFAQRYCGEFFNAVYQPDKPAVIEKIKSCIEKGNEYSCEYRMRTKQGELKWFLDTGTKNVLDDGTVTLTGVVSDITEMRKTFTEFEYQVHYDKLTGIYNRNNFYKQTQELLKNNSCEKYAIIRWDISNFKLINDLFGHEEGDRLLRYIAHTIKTVVGTDGTYGRFDADIFILCVKAENDNIEKIIKIITERLKLYPINFEILPCFGIYVIEDTTLPIYTMCDRANIAHHTIKNNFIQRSAYYSDDLRSNLVHEHEITSEMNNALEQEQFEVYLQPKYDLTYENIIGAEALVRWIHPEKGFIPPNMFIPIFERNGFVMKLDKYIWERTCMIIKRWKDEGRRIIPISVNISRIDLYDPHLCDFLINLVRKYDLDPKLLELEITESAYAENTQQLMPVIRRLQQHGFIILMDDFGTGYSSLNMLKDVPINILKIDMNFLSEDMEHGRGGIILSSIVRMAKWLSLPVVAEGVETNTQVDFLRSIGCNLAQGYYYSRPVPVAEFEKLMEYSNTASSDEKRHLPSDINFSELWNPNSTENVLFDNILDAVAMYEFNGEKLEIVRANDEYLRITGTSAETMNKDNRNLLECVHPDDVHIINEIVRDASEYIPKTIEFRRLKPNGSILWLRAKFKIFATSDDGEKSILYAAMSDITDRKKREINTDNKFEYISRAFLQIPSSFGVFEITDKMRTIFVNDIFCSHLGYGREYYDKYISEDLFALMSDDDVKNFRYIVSNSKLFPVNIVLGFMSTNNSVNRLYLSINIDKKSDGTLIVYVVTRPFNEINASVLSNDTLTHIVMSSVNMGAFDYNIKTDVMKLFIAKNGIYSEVTVKDYLSKPLYNSRIHKSFQADYIKWLKQLCSGNTAETIDLKANFCSETYRWFRGSGETISDENGEIVSVVACFKDIHLEKIIDVSSNDTADLFVSAIDLIPGGIFKSKADADFTILYANDNFYKMRGYTRGEFERFNHNKAIKCVHPDDAEYVRKAVLDAVEQRKETLQLEARIISNSGKIDYVIAKYKILYNREEPIIYGSTMKITKQKQLDLELNKQKQYNKAISSNALWYYDVDLTEDKVNNYYLKTKSILSDGNAPVSFTDTIKTFASTMHPDYQNTVAKIITPKNLIYEFENGNKHIDLKYTTLNSANEYIEVSANISITQNPLTGNIECFIFGIEIPDALRSDVSRDKIYHSIITSDLVVSYKVNFDRDTVEKYKGDDSVIDSVFKYDTFVKRIIARVYDELQKKHMHSLLNLDNINRRFETSSFSNSMEYLRIDKFGNPVWVRTSLVLSYDENGEKIGFINIRNINDYKLEQQLQRDILKIYSTELQNSYDLIYELNFTTNEILNVGINDNGMTLTPAFDGSLSAAVADLSNRLHPDYNRDEFKNLFTFEFLDSIFSKGTDEYHKTALVMDRGTNEYRWTSYWIRKVSWNERQDRVAMFYAKNVNEERSEQEKYNHMLKSALCMAEQANNAKSEFLSKMSHDIRTPINAIMGMSAIAQNNINDTDKVKSCIASIDESSKYLLKLINNVLDMSQIEMGKVVINKKEMNLVKLVDSLREMFKGYKTERNIDLNIFIDSNISEILLSDELHIKHILVNLLTNAFKYNVTNGSVKLELSLVQKTDNSEIIKFTVTDSGIGIDKKNMDKLFDPFEQFDKAYDSGNGLGLAIVHSLVNLLEGVIEVESTPGIGSVFTVTIPFDTADRNAVKETEECGNADKHYRFNGERILLVEDNELNCEIAKTLLEEVNLNVDIAQNGKIALDTFSEMPVDYYDAILMDIRMPVMDGREATKQIRALPRVDAKNIPIIAMSADAFSEDIKFSQRIGMDDYITKPVDTNKLYETLKNFLNE